MGFSAKECYATCSDYSCVRSGYCTGDAGRRSQEFYKQQELKKELQEFNRIVYLLETHGNFTFTRKSQS